MFLVWFYFPFVLWIVFYLVLLVFLVFISCFILSDTNIRQFDTDFHKVLYLLVSASSNKDFCDLYSPYLYISLTSCYAFSQHSSSLLLFSHYYQIISLWVFFSYFQKCNNDIFGNIKRYSSNIKRRLKTGFKSGLYHFWVLWLTGHLTSPSLNLGFLNLWNTVFLSSICWDLNETIHRISSISYFYYKSIY